MKTVLGVFLLTFLGLSSSYIVPAKLSGFPKVAAPIGKCPAVDEEFATLLPDNEDPSIFYLCDRGIPVKKNCPPNMVFDPILTVCVRKTNNLEHPKPLLPNGKCPAVDGWTPVYLSDTEDPTVFYECSNGVPIKMHCPGDLIFDTTRNICIQKEPTLFRDLAISFMPNGQCPPQNGEFPVFLPDTEDKTIYYECNHGFPIKMRCPAGLIFDPITNVCVRN